MASRLPPGPVSTTVITDKDLSRGVAGPRWIGAGAEGHHCLSARRRLPQVEAPGPPVAGAFCGGKS